MKWRLCVFHRLCRERCRDLSTRRDGQNSPGKATQSKPNRQKMISATWVRRRPKARRKKRLKRQRWHGETTKETNQEFGVSFRGGSDEWGFGGGVASNFFGFVLDQSYFLVGFLSDHCLVLWQRREKWFIFASIINNRGLNTCCTILSLMKVKGSNERQQRGNNVINEKFLTWTKVSFSVSSCRMSVNWKRPETSEGISTRPNTKYLK